MERNDQIIHDRGDMEISNLASFFNINCTRMNNEEMFSLLRMPLQFGVLSIFDGEYPRQITLPFVFRSGIIYLPLEDITIASIEYGKTPLSFLVFREADLEQEQANMQIEFRGIARAVDEAEKTDAKNDFAEKYFAGAAEGCELFSIGVEHMTGYILFDE